MFNATINKLNSQINDSQNAIAQLEAQLQQEREHLKQLQQQQQAFLTATSACDSAKEQVIKAIQLLNVVSPDNLAEFQEELNSLFINPNPDLIEETCHGTSVRESSQDSEEVQNDSLLPTPSHTVEVVVDDDVATADDLEELPLSYKDLMQEDYEILKAIANDMGLPNGSKGKVCSGLAKANITRNTINRVRRSLASLGF